MLTHEWQLIGIPCYSGCMLSEHCAEPPLYWEPGILEEWQGKATWDLALSHTELFRASYTSPYLRWFPKGQRLVHFAINATSEAVSCRSCGTTSFESICEQTLCMASAPCPASCSGRHLFQCQAGKHFAALEIRASSHSIITNATSPPQLFAHATSSTNSTKNR